MSVEDGASDFAARRFRQQESSSDQIEDRFYQLLAELDVAVQKLEERPDYQRFDDYWRAWRRVDWASEHLPEGLRKKLVQIADRQPENATKRMERCKDRPALLPAQCLRLSLRDLRCSADYLLMLAAELPKAVEADGDPREDDWPEPGPHIEQVEHPEFGSLMGLAHDELTILKDGWPKRLMQLHQTATQFWRCWNEAKFDLDELPDAVLSCLDRETKSNWKYRVHRIIDRLAMWCESSQPDPGDEDEADSQFIFSSAINRELPDLAADIQLLAELDADLKSIPEEIQRAPFVADVAAATDDADVTTNTDKIADTPATPLDEITFLREALREVLFFTPRFLAVARRIQNRIKEDGGPVFCEYPGETRTSARNARPKDYLIHNEELRWIKGQTGWPLLLREFEKAVKELWTAHREAEAALDSASLWILQAVDAAIAPEIQTEGISSRWATHIRLLLTKLSSVCRAPTGRHQPHLVDIVRSISRRDALPDLERELSALQQRDADLLAVWRQKKADEAKATECNAPNTALIPATTPHWKDESGTVAKTEAKQPNAMPKGTRPVESADAKNVPQLSTVGPIIVAKNAYSEAVITQGIHQLTTLPAFPLNLIYTEEAVGHYFKNWMTQSEVFTCREYQIGHGGARWAKPDSHFGCGLTIPLGRFTESDIATCWNTAWHTFRELSPVIDDILPLLGVAESELAFINLVERSTDDKRDALRWIRFVVAVSHLNDSPLPSIEPSKSASRSGSVIAFITPGRIRISKDGSSLEDDTERDTRSESTKDFLIKLKLRTRLRHPEHIEFVESAGCGSVGDGAFCWKFTIPNAPAAMIVVCKWLLTRLARVDVLGADLVATDTSRNAHAASDKGNETTVAFENQISAGESSKRTATSKNTLKKPLNVLRRTKAGRPPKRETGLSHEEEDRLRENWEKRPKRIRTIKEWVRLNGDQRSLEIIERAIGLSQERERKRRANDRK